MLSGVGRDRAVEHDLQRVVAGLVRVERQIVAEQDEALRLPRHLVDDVRADRSDPACPLRSGAGPRSAYLFSSALTSDDLPVPRAPVSSTLLAGSPRTNCRVFCSTRSLLAGRCRTGPAGGSGADAAPAARTPRPLRRRQRNAEWRRNPARCDVRRQQALHALEQRLGALQEFGQLIHSIRESGTRSARSSNSTSTTPDRSSPRL